MALLPPAFANPRQPLYIDGQNYVRITSGVLDITSATRDGAYISMSPTIFIPPYISPDRIPRYVMSVDTDYSFYINRTAIPTVPIESANCIKITPSSQILSPNIISANGDFFCLAGNFYSENDAIVEGLVSGGAGLRYEIDTLAPDGDPTKEITFYGQTFYLIGNPAGAGIINVELPEIFFESANPQYPGTTIFKLVSYNNAPQTVNLIDNRNPTPIVIVSVVTVLPSIVEAVRLDSSIVTNTVPLIANTVTPITLTAGVSNSKISDAKKSMNAKN